MAHIPKSWYTIALLFSFLLTTALLQWWQVSEYPKEIWIIFFFSILLFFGVGVIMRSGFSFLMLCIVIGASIGFFRVAETTHETTPEDVEYHAVLRGDRKDKELPRVTLRGYISDEPDRRPMQTKYTVAVDEISVPLVGALRATPLPVQGKILVTDHAFYPPHNYGDEVRVTGILEKPTQIEDFAYDRYLSRYGIYAVIYRGTIETLSGGHGSTRLTTSGSRFFDFLYSLKDRFEYTLNRLLPEPHASFMAGLLTGSRRGIPEHLLKDFQKTGLTHIIAISGYNIAIVIAVISGALFFLPLKWRLLPALIAITFFTLFVGASPSVVRAAIMGGLSLFALHVGRERHSLIAILFAAAAMVFFNPKLLWYDAGFQLSFLSVVGLSFLAPKLERFFRFVPTTLGFRESVQMTISAQLMAVPLIILLFGEFSLIAPLANILVAPLIPIAMIFGFLGTLAGFISEPLGLLIAYPGWGALEVVIRIAHFLAEIPYASVNMEGMRGMYVWGYYGVLFFVIVSWFFYKQITLRSKEVRG